MKTPPSLLPMMCVSLAVFAHMSYAHSPQTKPLMVTPNDTCPNTLSCVNSVDYFLERTMDVARIDTIRENIKTLSDTHSLEISVVWFMARLRVFVTGIEFDAAAFTRQAEFLRVSLEEISKWAQFRVRSPSLTARIKASQDMFRVMKIAKTLLPYYGMMNGTAYSLLCNILHFKVALMALASLVEPLSVKTPKTRYTLRSFYRILTGWERIFGRLLRVDPIVRDLFETQCEDCRIMFEAILNMAELGRFSVGF